MTQLGEVVVRPLSDDSGGSAAGDWPAELLFRVPGGSAEKEKGRGQVECEWCTCTTVPYTLGWSLRECDGEPVAVLRAQRERERE